MAKPRMDLSTFVGKLLEEQDAMSCGKASWVFINHHGRRKSKRVGDKETALRVAQGVCEKLARGELDLAPAAVRQTLTAYASVAEDGRRQLETEHVLVLRPESRRP